MSAGVLYIIPTPIGNMGDMTFRSVNILTEADYILAEDTRNTSKLLRHYKIDTPMHSFHSFNEHAKVEEVLQHLENGQNLALVSDAGTPGISDPGFLLTSACAERNIQVITLPGATALIPALVNSGLPMDKFVFEGFLPHKKGRQTRWKTLAEENRTMVFYESPHRILRFLDESIKFMGPGRKISMSREISKLYEETVRGTAPELLLHFQEKPPKGEFVVVIEGKR